MEESVIDDTENFPFKKNDVLYMYSSVKMWTLIFFSLSLSGNLDKLIAVIYDWFLQAASRHQCAYLIHLHEQEFILQGGDQDWLKGPAYIPTKLRKLHEVNKILAHRPWLFNKSHIEVESMLHVFISLWKLKCKPYKPELIRQMR